MSTTTDAVLRELEGLRALARSLVHGDPDADDLMQDAAIDALVHPPELDRPVRPWLATVVRNRWRMGRRTDVRRRAREDAVAPPRDDTAEAADAALDRARVLERLGAALVALDEPFRATVIARYLDGTSAAEIARAAGIPPGTVRWRLKTGLERLRVALEQRDPQWRAAFIPLAGQGAVLVKAKTSVLALIVLILVLGGVAFLALRERPHSDDNAPAASVTTTPPADALDRARAAVPRDAGLGAIDPLPGQGKATVAPSDAPGGALAGRVINWSTGGGVANAELTFTGDRGATTVRTHDDGSFELAPSSAGRFVLTAAVAQGFLPYAPELLHSTVHVSMRARETVRGITVFLFPAVEYKGKVVDARGAPIAGARVRLLGTPAGEQTIEKLAIEWTSSKDGSFVFNAADDAVLEASRGNARGWAQVGGDVQLTRELVISIAAAPARDATIRGTILDRANVPVADALVRAMPEEVAPTDAPRATAFATSGADGTFVLEDLDRGVYTIAAEAEGYAPAERSKVSGGTQDVTLVVDGGVPIAGRVVGPDEVAVPAFTLLVFARRGALRELVIARSIVDPAGRFEVRVPAGDYDLFASSSGWAPSAPTSVKAGTKDARIVVSAGATLSGVVVDAQTGKPIEYARIMREAPGGGASAQPANAGTVTRADGTFELAGIPAGPVSITVGAGGFHPRIESGMVASDGGRLGPVRVALTRLAEGETPTLELVGIGVKLAGKPDGLQVDMVVPASGAADAGILVGDHVIAVDGVDVDTLGIDGAVSKIRGLVGTTVAITVRRAGESKQFVVTRKKLKL